MGLMTRIYKDGQDGQIRGRAAGLCWIVRWSSPGCRLCCPPSFSPPCMHEIEGCTNHKGTKRSEERSGSGRGQGRGDNNSQRKLKMSSLLHRTFLPPVQPAYPVP